MYINILLYTIVTDHHIIHKIQKHNIIHIISISYAMTLDPNPN
jgi:hypothetical protein